ncbi:hypothetical protein LguiA_021619 [Lonicera macranthoides]
MPPSSTAEGNTIIDMDIQFMLKECFYMLKECFYEELDLSVPWKILIVISFILSIYSAICLAIKGKM